jgi:LmbE family N-acetylglucosaminyl deacetylase
MSEGMLAATAFSQMRALPIRAFADTFGQTTTLILAPHPDDESLGCGGMIAEACAAGNPPVVVILTDGSKSHPRSRAYPADRLRALREEEAKAALSLLGLGQERLFFLRYPDGDAPREGAALAEAAETLAALIAEYGCGMMAVSWRHDPHCDHAAAAAIAAYACRLAGARLVAYPVWAWSLPSDMVIDEAPIRGFRLEISRHLSAKRAAIAAHRSQYAGLIDDDPDGFQMPAEFIESFLLPVETYLDVDVAA